MNAANLQIGDWLGLRAPATESDILRLVEGRLASSVIARLSALGLECSEIDETVIPSRTLQHRRSRREKRSSVVCHWPQCERIPQEGQRHGFH